MTCPRVEVETAFGEVFSGEAVVVAVGLGFGGQVGVGEDVMSGGRYGEVAADGLYSSLRRQGVVFRRAEIPVGRRIPGSRVGSVQKAAEFSEDSEIAGTIPVGVLLESSSGSGVRDARLALTAAREALLGIAQGTGPLDGMARKEWPTGNPLVPHRVDGLRLGSAVMPSQLSDLRSETGREPRVSPDGASTAELYLMLGEEVNATDDIPASRLEHVITADIVAHLDDRGRMPELPGVWVAGQVAGAVGYLESLRSGIEVASAVLEDLYAALTGGVRGGHDFRRLEGAG